MSLLSCVKSSNQYCILSLKLGLMTTSFGFSGEDRQGADRDGGEGGQRRQGMIYI